MSDIATRLNAALEGRYRIERELGSGGMGTVFLAEDLKHHRNVAIKVLRPELAAMLGAARFLREIEIVARIEHPHILTLIDSGDADGLLFIVMPYLKGESLRTRLAKEGKLPIADVVRLVREVADGLAEAHRNGLVHRDIKPDNVMMSGQHAVLMDFGVAKAMSTATGEHQVTTAGIALGTPAYMSPEQAAADPSVDHRTDIYALGALAYELLTGRPPYAGTTYAQILAAHVHSTPAPVTEHRPETPAALDALIMKCLERAPEDRWQKTDELVRQLEAIATPSGGVPSMRMPARKAPGGRGLVARVLGVAGIVIVVAVLGMVWQHRATATRALVARLDSLVAAGDLNDAHVLLTESGRGLHERAFASIAQQVGGIATIATRPTGATVRLARVWAMPDSVLPGLAIDATPAEATLFAGSYLATLEAAGHETAQFLISMGAGETVALDRTLIPVEWDARDMVYVAAGPVPGPLSERYTGTEVQAFLIDRFEVSNERYMEFMADGGYRNRQLWPESVYLAGRWVPRDEALRRWVDRTGLPGPRGWSGGTFPDGQDDHPVTGVTWYEAAAFAEWSGKALPTLQQWWRAALGDSGARFPWGDDLQSIDERSNFTGVGTTPVTRFRTGMSPWGALDMAGNVKEWTVADPGDSLQVVLGGSWQSPIYMFDWPNLETLAVSAGNGEVGFRLVKAVPDQGT